MTLNHDFSRRYEKLPVFIYDDQIEASSYLVNNILTLLTQKESREKLVLGLSARRP